MRPGQLAQITRRNIQLTGGGADIRVMLHQQTLNPREIKPTATRRNRKPTNRRPPPHSNAHPTDRRKTRSRSTNSARRNEASNCRRRSKTRPGRGWSLAGEGEERRARNRAIRGPGSLLHRYRPTPPQAMPTTEMVVVNPQPPYPLAAMTDHKSPPPAVGKVDVADAEFGAHALEMNPSPSVGAPDLLLGDQTRNSHRGKIVNE